MHYRLANGRAAQGQLSGALPIESGALPKPSLSKVMGHRLRLGGHDIRKPLFERSGNGAMQLVAPAANQTCVRGVLHKRVLELIRGIGRTPRW